MANITYVATVTDETGNNEWFSDSYSDELDLAIQEFQEAAGVFLSEVFPEGEVDEDHGGIQGIISLSVVGLDETFNGLDEEDVGDHSEGDLSEELMELSEFQKLASLTDKTLMISDMYSAS